MSKINQKIISLFHNYKKMRSVLKYVSIFVIFIAISIFSSIASAIEYGGVGGRPAYPRLDNPRTESIFIHNLEPSAIQKEGILLVNNTAERKTLLVYAVDSLVSSGGAFTCRQFSEPKQDVGAWITLVKSETTLDSGTNEMVPFTIAVPQNTGVGEHNGCIVVQEKKEKPEGGSGMGLTFRTGLRVAVTIPGEVIRKLEIAGFKVERKEGGKFILKPLVKNLGNVSIDTNIQVLTKNLLGSIYAEQGGQYPVLRGETSEWNFELKKPFWGGWYRSSFAVVYEENPQAEIGKTAGEARIRLEGLQVWFFSSPQPTALAIEMAALFLIVFLGFLVWLSIKRKKWIKKNWVEYEIKTGEDIKLLAERFDVSWKLLAKVNRLEPPYVLKPSTRLKVPPKS